MAKYDPIWRTLKDKGIVSLAIAPALQPRVIKGVIHAKDHDLAYKLELDSMSPPRWAKLSYVQEHARVIINLETFIKMKQLTVEDF